MTDSAPTTRVFLVDDHPSVRRALRGAIEEERGLKVCGEAASTGEALGQIQQLRPEAAVVDISLEDGHGLDFLDNLQALAPETGAVVYSMFEEKVYAERAIRAGASAYLQKSEPPGKITQAIRATAKGEIYLSHRMRRKILNRLVEASTQGGESSEGDTSSEKVARPATSDLTDRELAVFQMIGLGYNMKEIEGRLCLSRKTIETYRRRAKEKLGIGSVDELVRHAVRWVDGRGTQAQTG